MKKTIKHIVAAKAASAATLTPAEEAVLVEVSGFFASIGRRTTGDALDLGNHLLRAKNLLPEKRFGKWVAAECHITPRSARLYLDIIKLSDRRERLVSSAVSPTIMFALASADNAKIEEVLVTIEKGERLTVAKVKAMVKGEQTVAAKPVDVTGGAAGFLKAATAKVKQETEDFGRFTKNALKHVEKAADALTKGKHVSKTSLANLVEMDCQKASALLRSAIAPIATTADMSSNSAWHRAQRTLGMLGDAPRWPGRAEFPVWVMGEALRVLRFVVHGTPIEVETGSSEMSLSPAATVEAGVTEADVDLDSKAPPSRFVPMLVHDAALAEA